VDPGSVDCPGFILWRTMQCRRCRLSGKTSVATKCPGRGRRLAGASLVVSGCISRGAFTSNGPRWSNELPVIKRSALRMTISVRMMIMTGTRANSVM
jgi:hypothetical protein